MLLNVATLYDNFRYLYQAFILLHAKLQVSKVIQLLILQKFRFCSYVCTILWLSMVRIITVTGLLLIKTVIYPRRDFPEV